jgi:hypothetical protein
LSLEEHLFLLAVAAFTAAGMLAAVTLALEADGTRAQGNPLGTSRRQWMFSSHKFFAAGAQIKK